ncbi:MAG TPA: hypothetical protein PLS03_15250, partial [Terrimicrobiaceae bacterium]|nr:hypothetical protein [Terrimicrobiaceae bacterium]
MKKSSALDAVFARAAAALGSAFDGVAASAQPFAAAVLARNARGKRVWFVCPDVKTQEHFAAELAAWHEGTRLFPELEIPEGSEALPDPETAAERLEILRALDDDSFVGPIVLHASQWEQDVPSAPSLSGALLKLRRGDVLDFREAADRLLASGYERTPQVTGRGQFAIRGGIFDVFSWQAPLPVRVELDDLTIDSIRTFDLDGQMSLSEVPDCEILAGKLNARLAPLAKYVRKADLVAGIGDEDAEASWKRAAAVQISEGGDGPALHPQPFADFGAGDLVLDTVRRDRFFRQLEDWKNDGWMIVLAAGSEGEMERFSELAAEHHFDADALTLLKIPIARGFTFPAARLAVLADAELFGRSASVRA